jgi:hypothetical protein
MHAERHSRVTASRQGAGSSNAPRSTEAGWTVPGVPGVPTKPTARLPGEKAAAIV